MQKKTARRVIGVTNGSKEKISFLPGKNFKKEKMAKDPAVLFYTSDFLTGTMTMTHEEVGMYIRLLCLQHQKGRLSHDDMLYICKTYVKHVYLKFSQDEGGRYYNERMELESEKRKRYSESRKNNVTQRYKKGNNESTYVEHMENENINRDENIKKIQRKKKQKTFDFESIWARYPVGKKLGKKICLGIFNNEVKTEQDYQNILKSLSNYLKSKRVLDGYAQDAHNWFDKWQDWIDYVEPECEKFKGGDSKPSKDRTSPEQEFEDQYKKWEREAEENKMRPEEVSKLIKESIK